MPERSDSVSAASIGVGIETLRANPMRTLLSTLGIIMGAAALVAVLALGDGMQRYMRDQIEKTTDLQTIVLSPSLSRVVDGERFPRNDVVVFDRVQSDSLAAEAAEKGVVTLLLSGQAIATTRTDTTPTVSRVYGTLENAAAMLPTAVDRGRFYTKEEVESEAPVVVLSAGLGARLAGGRVVDSLLGDSVLFQGQPRAVIGLLRAEPDAQGALAFMPLGAASSALPPSPVARPITIAIKANRVEDVPVIRARAESWLARRYGADWSNRVSVSTNESRVEQARQGMNVFKLFMGALTGISLIVGGVGIMNVLLASVVERTREIGIRKAVGARQRHILLQFLAESVTISALGSIVGVLLGLGTAFGVTAVMRSATAAPIHAGFSLGTVLIAVGASVFVGLVFGIYPALQAARLAPVEAIHRD
jgi:putative ABC transport system permease protein